MAKFSNSLEMRKRLVGLTRNVEELSKVLDDTQTELKETTAELEDTEDRKRRTIKIMETLKGEIRRCSSALGNVEARKQVNEMGQERDIDPSKTAAEDAIEELDKALAGKKEADNKLKQAQVSLSALTEKSQQLLTELIEVKSQVTEVEAAAHDAPGGSVFAIVEALRGEIVKKTENLQEIQVVADQLRENRAAINEELSTAQRGRLMVQSEMKHTKSYADLAQQKATLSKDYARKLEELKDIRKKNVEFGGHAGVQDLAEQLEDAKALLEEESMLMKAQEETQKMEYQAHRDSLRAKTNHQERIDAGQLNEIQSLNKELVEAQCGILSLQKEIRDLELTNTCLTDEASMLDLLYIAG